MRAAGDGLTWIVLAGSVAALAAAFLFQYGVGLAPCPLCLYQRWPYYAAIPLTLAAFVIAREGFAPGWRRLALALCALGFAAGAALAVYHVGIEHHWWPGPTSCTGGGGARTLDDLRAQLMATPVVRCDEAPWSLFGVSLAGFNAVASLVLAVLAALAAAAPWPRRG